jgi:hypothetical protein
VTADLLAGFYRATGHRVVDAAGAIWFDASPRIWQSLPGVKLLDPPRDALRDLVRRHRLAGVQFATAAEYGLPSCAYAVRDKGYGPPSISRTFRQNLRRGEARCEVREIGFDELGACALPVNRDALGRRGYRDPRFLDPDRWRRFCAAAASSPGAGALASFCGDRLASYLLYVVDRGTCHGLHMLSGGWARPERANHLLYYEFTRRMIGRPDVGCVSTGLGAHPPAGEIDRFKRGAGYHPEGCRLAVVLHPAVERILLSRPQAALFRVGERLGDRPGLVRARAVADIARATRPR